MAKLFLGIRIPKRAYERLPIENVDLEQSVCNLRHQVAEKLECPKEDIELLYCGNILEDEEKMSDLNIKPNTTIHVLKKNAKPSVTTSSATYTEEDCQKIADTYMEVTGTQINVQSRMNILQKILDEYPEFRRNLGAQALIRDSVLFNSLDRLAVIKKVSENYPLICEAAGFIVKTVKKEITKNYVEHAGSTLSAEELFSDLTSGSEEESNQANSEQARIRRISRDQLAAALSQIGSGSSNSLSNIAQRNTDTDADNTASTSTSSPSGTSSSPIRISSSLLNNALRNALLSTTATATQSQDSSRNEGSSENQSSSAMMDTSENNQGNTSELNNAIQRNLFANELQIMHEVGLTDDTINLQALILARGKVEEAINFVYMWSSIM